MKRFLLSLIAFALLPLGAAAQPPQTVTPNGIARIGAANETTIPLDYADIGVAIIDTGIDLSNPDLNVVGGVDCSGDASAYSAGNVAIEGGQESIWRTAPLIYQDGVQIPDPEYLSFDGLEFRIASQENPAKIGGMRAGITGYDDGNGHGTHVAGIVAARDNGLGVVGVAPNVSLYSVRVLGAQGGGSLNNLICGLDWVAANADVIDVANMSLGAATGRRVMDVIEPCETSSPSGYAPYVQQTSLLRDELHEAVCRVVEAGVVVVVAAGNGWGDAGTVIPAAYPEVITVSSFADFDGRGGGLALDTDPDPDINTVSACPEMGGMDDAFFTHLNGSPALGYGSFAGESVAIAAPGVCVLSTFPNAGMLSLTGTSMAAPHVTGAVARLVQEFPYFSAEAVRQRLMVRAEKQPATFRDSDDWHEPLVRVGGP